MSNHKKNIVSYLLAFLQAIFLVIGVSVTLIYFGFLSRNAIERSLDQADYYEGLTADIKVRSEDFLIPTGISTTVLEGVFTAEMVREHVQMQIQNAFLRMDEPLDFSSMENELSQNIVTFLNDQQETLSQEEIDGLIQAVMSQYELETRFPFISHLARLINLYRGLVLIVGVGSILLFLIATLTSYRMHHRPHRRLRFQSYSFGGGALMLFVIPLVLLLNGSYTRLAIGPEYVHRFFIIHVERILRLFMIMGGIALVLAILYGVISERQRSELIKRHRFSRRRSNRNA